MNHLWEAIARATRCNNEKPDCKQHAWLVDIDDVIKEAEWQGIGNNRGQATRRSAEQDKT
jgi:hypothetical protein